MSQTTQRDIALDLNGDIDVSAQDLKLVSGIDAILQAVSVRLKFFQGEWFLDESVGVPYYQSVFVKNPNVNVLTAVFRKAILDTPGVKSLTSLSLNYNSQARTLAVTFAADTDFGAFDAQTVELTQ